MIYSNCELDIFEVVVLALYKMFSSLHTLHKMDIFDVESVNLIESVKVYNIYLQFSVIVSNGWFFQSLYTMTDQISHCVNSLKLLVIVYND